MKYLCLACGEGSAWEKLAEEQQQDYVARCRVHDEALAADERGSGPHRLAPSRGAHGGGA